MGHPLAGSCVALNIIRSIDHDQPQKNFKYLWLAFSGSVLLLASLVYFVTIGSISNKAAQLLAACNASNMQSCAVQSATWAKQIGLWIIPAFLGIQIAVTVQSSARKTMWYERHGSPPRVKRQIRPLFETVRH